MNIEMFIFDEAQHGGRKLSDLLVEVAGKGIAVNVLYDSLGSSDTPPAVLEKLRTAGSSPLRVQSNQSREQPHGKIRATRSPQDRRRRRSTSRSPEESISVRRTPAVHVDHGKTDPIAEGWRDTQVEMAGPVTLELQRLFLESWDKQKCSGRRPANYLPAARDAGSTLLRIDATSTDSKRNETYISALSALTFARKSIDLTMAYFSPDDQVEEALIDAARRGVRVRLLLAGLTDFGGIVHAGRAHYTRLLKAGVQIFEQQEVLLHAKTLEVDGIWSTVGSANWDWRSFANNDELNVVIIDAGFAQQMQAQFETDLASASPIILSEWKKRPLRDKALQQFWVMWERLL